MPHEVSAINRVRDQARRQMQDLSGFNYNAPAELFPSGNRKGKSFFAYKRFDTAAEALRYAVEQLPQPALLGSYLEVDEARFGFHEINALYESASYPLKRLAKVG
jgi:hypothetical protein